jgi:hypothetical protein
MQPDAHPHGDVLLPGVRGQRALDVDGGTHRIASAGKDHEKGIALRIHLMPLKLRKVVPQHLSALFQESSIALS